MTKPEFVVSNDPEDPTYYSTCYVRETERIWLPMDPTEPVVDWKAHDKCIDCDSFYASQVLDYERYTWPFPRWNIPDDVCVDCDSDYDYVPAPYAYKNI